MSFIKAVNNVWHKVAGSGTAKDNPIKRITITNCGLEMTSKTTVEDLPEGAAVCNKC